ncbi:transporter [Sodalis ligni]|uniref:transporter n=1 Tax=Sodalis ligni TaxID=2697027 RepID=UPI0014054AE9|nr:transporter [Sodalis ligni]
MKKNIFIINFAAVTLLTTGLPCFMAQSAEGISPLLPGATTGGAAGALPPDGIYFSMDAEYEYGHVSDGSGDTARTPGGEKIKEKNASAVASLLWAPGWEILGARYGAAIAQPYKFTRTKFHDGPDNSTVDSNGLVNTSITPAILSWDLGNGYHLGTGLAVVLPNGKFDSSYSAAEGRKVKSSTTIGNNFGHLNLTWPSAILIMAGTSR